MEFTSITVAAKNSNAYTRNIIRARNDIGVLKNRHATHIIPNTEITNRNSEFDDGLGHIEALDPPAYLQVIQLVEPKILN